MSEVKFKICLDAGHFGKYNQSPVDKAYYESDMVWKLHKILAKKLKKLGFQVVVTRSSQEKDRGLFSRGMAAKGCDMFLSLHSNAASKESVDYPVVYRGYDKDHDTFANALAKVIAGVMGTVQMGREAIRKGTNGEYYGVMRGARAAGVEDYYIVEHSFHTNKKAAKWLLDDKNLEKLADAECKVIVEHFKKKGQKKKRPQEEKRSGSFKVRTTCDSLRIRSGAGEEYRVTGSIDEKEGKKNLYTIIETKGNWGKLKSGAGWIFLGFTERVD